MGLSGSAFLMGAQNELLDVGFEVGYALVVSMMMVIPRAQGDEGRWLALVVNMFTIAEVGIMPSCIPLLAI